MGERPLRVLQVLGTSTGGIGQHVRSLTAGLVSRGHRVVVAGPVETDQLFDFGSTGARFVEAPIAVNPSPRDLRVARALGRWVRGADVVHAHGFRAGIVSLNAGSGAGWPFAGVRKAGTASDRGVPLVVTWHNAVMAVGLKGQVMHRVEAAVAKGATLNLGASQDLVQAARDAGGRAELGMVAPPRPHPAARDREEVRRSAGLVGADADVAPMVLAVGRLHPQKDYPTMLRAMARLSRRRPTPALVVAGDGPEADTLAELADFLGVSVQWLGRRSDVADLMAAADLLVVSSTWEARALVVQEAMQLGLPVVATAVGGIPELIRDDALLVSAGDVVALATAIESVLVDPAAAQRRASHARKTAAEWPDESAVVDRVLAAYREVGGSA